MDDARIAQNRQRLIALAYRMLGERGEAEDAVQEALLRYTGHDGPIDNAEAWLTTVTTRICLDRLTSAQRRREAYIGPWLPEPIATDTPDPADAADLADSLTLGFLVVLERLSPLERAAFLLHDVFGYAHDEVAAMLERTPAAVRQVTSRARAHLDDGRPRYDRDGERREAVARRFAQAADGGDLEALMAVLAPDVTFVADGGGVVPASRHPARGAELVARRVHQFAGLRPVGWAITLREVNGEPAIVVSREDGAVDTVWVLHTEDDLVLAIHAIRNPAKLTALRADR
ncbi:RNA polymerase sigma factor SigJ [Euzebya tangerina]|uniref:RNA polymerase sigma factor SigJ n=1 Tax=Euzebya tangerina TaxID=591198 RepID=UPI000E317B81|nr:RNA polymerase sigma factor SigJ [Euzebya tangerina]